MSKGRSRALSKKERAAQARERSQFVYRLRQSNFSGLGVALSLALLGLFIAFMPAFFGLATASIPSDLVISFAIALLLISLLGTRTEFGEIKSLVDVGSAEGWLTLLVALLLLSPAAVLLLGVTLLESPAWFDLILKSLTAILGVLGVFVLAKAFDDLFIRPKLEQMARRSGKNKTNPLPIGSIVSFVTWIVSNTAGFLAIVQRLFF